MFHLSSFSRTSFSPISWAPADESQVPEEELRPEYRGGAGNMLPARDPFKDGRQLFQEDPADIERLVREKWEAIDSARAAERAQETALSSTRQAPPVEKAQETVREVALTLPIIKASLPEVPPLTAAVDPDATEARRLRSQRNDEQALILMLAELL